MTAAMGLYQVRGAAKAWTDHRLEAITDLEVDAYDYYKKILNAPRSVNDHQPEFNANSWLREVYSSVKPFFRDSASRDIESIANSLADRWAGAVKYVQSDDDAAVDLLAEKAETFLGTLSLKMPAGKTTATALLRLVDVKWWRKKLNTAVPRIVDQTARKFGRVHKDAEIYISDAAFKMYLKRAKANREFLDETIATNDCGQEYKLSELGDKSISNPHIRRTEVMVRLRGLDEYSEAMGYEALFVTLTSPSKYHKATIHEDKKTGIKEVRINGKWNHSDPRAVNGYFNRVWSRIRANLARQGVVYFGIRVAEPHHDGTPHAHYLLFTRADNQILVESAFREHGMAEDGTEQGARKYRIKFVRIDRSEGSAVGYIAKYISKAINGHGITSDRYGFNARNSAARITAWSRVWGIRQFQFCGTAPVGIWRELRRLRSAVREPYEDARTASDNAEFADFLRRCDIDQLSLYRLPDFDLKTGEISEAFNNYGEQVKNPVIGIVAEGHAPLITKLFCWTVKRSSALASASAAGSTCVNNCTPDLFTEPFSLYPDFDWHFDAGCCLDSCNYCEPSEVFT